MGRDDGRVPTSASMVGGFESSSIKNAPPSFLRGGISFPCRGEEDIVVAITTYC